MRFGENRAGEDKHGKTPRYPRLGLHPLKRSLPGGALSLPLSIGCFMVFAAFSKCLRRHRLRRRRLAGGACLLMCLRLPRAQCRALSTPLLAQLLRRLLQ